MILNGAIQMQLNIPLFENDHEILTAVYLEMNLFLKQI